MTLPEADPGRYVTPEAPIEIGENEVTLTSLYLSPISLAWELGEEEDDLESLDHSALHGLAGAHHPHHGRWAKALSRGNKIHDHGV